MPKTYIDLTPTWSALLPGILMAYEDNIHKNNPRSISTIHNLTGELARMAEAADKWNEYCSALDEASGAAEMQRINEGLGGPLPVEESNG